MTPDANKKLAIAAMALGSFLLFTGPTLFLACQPPVSDEATVSVSGQVLGLDGTPMANVTVRLVKTELDVLEADWVVGHIANTDKQPFREVETDQEGRYYIEFTGAEANAGNQLWAAYFVAYVISPDDPDRHMAVASDSFQFSNQMLDKEVPDLQLWDIPAQGISVGQEFVSVEFNASRIAPEGGRYILHVEGTEWTAEVTGTSYQLPLTVLEPCLEPVIDDPAQCTPKTEHRLQIISLAPGVRSRTAWHSFTAQNPRGLGVWYRGEDNTSGHTCSGLNLYDLHDGKFSGKNAVQVLDQGMTAQDFRCLQIDLLQEFIVDEVILHNAAIWFHKQARIKFLATAVAQPTDADWVELLAVDGAENFNPMLNVQLRDIDMPMRHLRIEFVDVGATPFWQRVGEVTVYGAPALEQ